MSAFSPVGFASKFQRIKTASSQLLDGVEEVAVFTLDPHGRIVSWHIGAERITGHPSEAVLNRPFSTLFSPGDVAAGVPDHILSAALADGRYQEEMRQTRKDGTAFVGLLTLSALFNDDRPIGFAVLIRDVGRERRYRAMLEGGSDVVSVHDADGTMTYQSPSVERVLGYTPDELLGRKLSDYLHPDDLAAAAEYTDRLKAGGGGPSSVEVRFRHKSGEWRWFDSTGTNLLADSAVNGIQFTARDVTDRKRVEADLRRSERRYRTLATASNKLIWTATPGGEMIPTGDDASDTTFSGRQPEESSGWGWVDIVHPDDRDRATREWREAVASGQPLVTEARIRRADGEWRRIAARMVPVKDAAGKIEEWVGVGEDVTDLRNTETWLRAVLNSTFDGIVTTDERGVIVSANASAHRKFGYPDGELVGQPVTSLLADEDRDRHSPRLSEYLRTVDSPITGAVQQLTGRRKDGSTFPVELAVTGFRLQEARHFTGVVRDLSLRRQAESAMQASEQRLRAIIETAPLCVKLVACDGTVLEMNAAGVRMMDAEGVDEVAGHSVYPLVVPEDRDRYSEFHTAVCEGTPGVLEYRIVGRRGGRRTLESSATPFHMQGSVIGALCVSQDVTERLQAEEQLRLRDRAIQSLAEGILITDPNQPDNPIIYASPGFHRMTGYTGPEVVGKNCRFLQGNDTDPVTVAELRRAVAEGRPCSVEILNYRKDGTSFWNALSISPVRNGHLTHFIGVQSDVTERRRLDVRRRLLLPFSDN